MRKIEQIERDLFWNRHVLELSKDPAQKARVKARIEKFEEELKLAQMHERAD